jgi:hypothetical protein
MPAVDQPLVEVDRREVDKMLVSHLPTMAWSPAATLPSFIKLQTMTNSFTRKEDYNGYFTVCTYDRGNTVPKRTKVSPTKE